MSDDKFSPENLRFDVEAHNARELERRRAEAKEVEERCEAEFLHRNDKWSEVRQKMIALFKEYKLDEFDMQKILSDLSFYVDYRGLYRKRQNIYMRHQIPLQPVELPALQVETLES